ncbi:MAG: hypothetical protein IJZ62_04030 [Clostridia bacterium]|nr:hypothetical protein [Clostridia bacterium]
MYKVELKNEMVERKMLVGDLMMAIEELAEYIGDTTANGHIMDMETGEVLETLSCGEVVYISHETQIDMLQALSQAEPEVACLLAMFGFGK